MVSGFTCVGSTSEKQNKKMPVGKTGLIGPAAPAGGAPPADSCSAVYVKEGDLQYDVLDGWWTDAGTFESLYRASQLVASSVPAT